VRSNAPRSARSLTKAQLVEEVKRLRELLARTDGPARESSGTEEAERFRRELAETVEQQTATNDILRVISRSPTDTQPVFDIIAANAARLCAARDAQVLRVEGDVLRLVSAYGSPSTGVCSQSPSFAPAPRSA
jgi:hypothetical protein